MMRSAYDLDGADWKDVTDDWFAVSWHGRGWALLEWDIERTAAMLDDPRFGPEVAEVLDDPDALDADLGGFISVSQENGGGNPVHEHLLGDDASAFVCDYDAIRYVMIAGPFPNEYMAQYHIDVRLAD